MAGSSRLDRKEAVGMDVLIENFIKEMKLSSGLNRQRVFEAWDQASSAGPATIRKGLKNGVLYCSISSSALRQQLFFRRTEILNKINAILKEDTLFTKDGKDGNYLKNIILQ